MGPERESAARALAVAGGVALVCSLLVSVAVYWLRPIQAAYESIERNRAILASAGLTRADEAWSDREIVDRFLELDVRLVDMDAGELVDTAGAAGYEYREAMGNSAGIRPIAPEHDIAELGRRPRVMPVYLLAEGEALERIVLPVYGPGMWSTIHGFVSLGPDLVTVAGVRFYEHGETPGIGDRIQHAAWTSQWEGKRIYADDGTLVLRVGAAVESAAAAGRVDGITGATVTVTAVDRLVRYWFGEDGYGPFLSRLRASEGR